MPLLRSLLTPVCLSLCACLVLACSGSGQRDAQTQAAKRVDFSGSWELDYSQSDNIQARLNSMVRELRRQAERRAQSGGYQQGGATLSVGGSGPNSGESIIGLARMAELITNSNLLEIEQNSNRIKVKREENFALSCDFPAAGYNTVETPLGSESCGWNSHQLVFRILLPEGLSIQHVMTLEPEGQRLNMATTVVSDRVSYPFTLNRVFNRFVPRGQRFQLQDDLDQGPGMYHGIPVNRIGLCLAGCLLVLLPGLSVSQAQELAVPELPAPVGEVRLQVPQQLPEHSLLDVGLVIFDPGIPADTSTHSKLGIFPEIRKAEAQFMAVILRQVLIDTTAWGVVRVLPEALASSEILLTGKILQSDGLRLVVQVQARDATGRNWLDKIYVDESTVADYPVAPGSDPYVDLYRQIANDLLAFRQGLDARALRQIRQVGVLRYAASLSPEAFAGYLEQNQQGLYSLRRLPANGDPMMARVQRIRNQEYLFVDTVDEQYATLYQEMAPTYHLWRQFGREQAIYRAEYQQRVANRESRGRRGSFIAMEQTYNAYKWSKIHEQDLEELALGFDNEVAPTVIEVSGKVFRLNGTLDNQYSEWRDILRKIFALETGLPEGSSQ